MVVPAIARQSAIGPCWLPCERLVSLRFHMQGEAANGAGWSSDWIWQDSMDWTGLDWPVIASSARPDCDA